ncbi:StAR-related lipid transfer protein 3 [Sparganum proliferum]
MGEVTLTGREEEKKQRSALNTDMVARSASTNNCELADNLVAFLYFALYCFITLRKEASCLKSTGVDIRASIATMGDTRGYAHSIRLDPDHRIFGLSDYNLAASSAVEGLPDEQKSSPVRRTFLLMITFEFILTVVLWLIYLRTRGPIIISMTNEVKFYNFTSSLFDVQILAASRFTALEICYGCILTSSRWPSIVKSRYRVWKVKAVARVNRLGANETQLKQLAAHAVVTSSENFGLVEFECVAGSRRMSRNLRAGVIPPHCCSVFVHSRLEQSSGFSDVVALSKLQQIR